MPPENGAGTDNLSTLHVPYELFTANAPTKARPGCDRASSICRNAGSTGAIYNLECL